MTKLRSNLKEIKAINRTNDYAFKRIFGSEEGKEVLINFLNAVLQLSAPKEIKTIELLDREIEPTYLLDRGARLDVLAKTAKGILINIEVQIGNQYNIDKRTLYYWAGLYHGQLTQGQQFKELRKTITINIIAFDWFTDETRYHHKFHIQEAETKQILNDDLEIHFLELKKAKKLKRKPQKTLEAWLMYLNNLEGEELEEIAMENPAIKKAITIEQAFMKNKIERRIYELREKAVRDEISALAGAKEEGRAEGKAEGKAEGVQDSICKYLEARFGKASLEVQKKLRTIDDLEKLNSIINKIYKQDTIEEIRDLLS
ncbi:Rpn family recombination-promoting nuclease/putative transposase [Heliorestis convoluta]|uniref:Rpn family recombination-promoting nuclease/putative transposase n=1 Tax=Heliorestis convoluta TaxID=356322 RepID=A0A5Q2MYP3_9FIRM|nr:Rpn family recombination-promoting nuclease/putative transposase [Heliorestis convoluta]QGG48064.1 hypothetical protein FTV88_1966 [Heliorestis convoluta]